MLSALFPYFATCWSALAVGPEKNFLLLTEHILGGPVSFSYTGTHWGGLMWSIMQPYLTCAKVRLPQLLNTACKHILL
jgi:hypothetical protein